MSSQTMSSEAMSSRTTLRAAPRVSLGVLAVVVSIAGCRSADPAPEVAACVTLDDGQLLVGTLPERSLRLTTGLGELNFDVAALGELEVSGARSGEEVSARAWLRNGSEFVGAWTGGDLRLNLSLGDERQAMRFPLERVRRVQFAGHPVWPRDVTFRVQTRFGDDFFVDLRRTRIRFSTEFGELAPPVREIQRLETLDRQEGRFRLTLVNGSRLHGRILDRKLSFRLAMGPDRVEVALADVVGMDRQALRIPASSSLSKSAGRRSDGIITPAGLIEGSATGVEKRAGKVFFSREGFEAAKQVGRPTPPKE